MKHLIFLPALTLVFSLALSCNKKSPTAPWQLISPPDGDIGEPANFVDTAFLLLDDCILENYPSTFEERITYYATGFAAAGFSIEGNKINYAIPSNLCGYYPVVDSNGVVYPGITKRGGCEGYRAYKPDGSHLPEGFVMDDTLYLRDHLLANWPEGRPEWDHVLYTRIKAEGDTSRYAFPRLCGQFLLIDEDGLPANYYLGVGGCVGYQEMINR